MNRSRLVHVLSAAMLVACAPVLGGSWKPADGPLATKWSAQVSPERVLPEYPRPAMARDTWMNLNGLWEFSEIAPGAMPETGKPLPGTILVPFCPESALSGVMKSVDRVAYRRTFEVPAAWKGQRVLLHFGAVDWETTVSVNGRVVGSHRGGYDPFSFDITGALQPSGKQELIVAVFDPTDAGEQPRGKQSEKPHGIFYVPTTGIWQTVWLEPVPETHIGGLVLTPEFDSSSLRVRVDATTSSADTIVEALVFDGKKQIARGTGQPGADFRIPIRPLKPWSPDSPFLYDLKVSLKQQGRTTDEVDSYFGMRKIEVKSDGRVPRIWLNNKQIFQVGVLDQGYWPDGIFTAPTDEALRYDVEVTKKLGFNMSRKHIKVEPQRWYYWADKLGLLVWQDMPSSWNKTAEGRAQHEVELRRMIETVHHHPSIILLVVFNEGWGQFDTERLTKLAKELDPTRLVTNASGWVDHPVGDIVDTHVYPGPACPHIETERAAVLGEYGGLMLTIPGHTWAAQEVGYLRFSDREGLAAHYERLLAQVWGMKDNPGLCAAVYTQLTDLEGEINGLLTYDRAVIKFDARRIRDANLGRGAQTELIPVVPSAQTEAVKWKYTFDKPAGGWEKPGFDDSKWQEGPAGFGTKDTPGAVVRTDWNTTGIWLRREFELPRMDTKNLRLYLHHDEDVRVYINGVEAAKENSYDVQYKDVAINEKGRAALKPGAVNLIAVHCRQRDGGQYIDVGLVEAKTKPRRKK